MKLQTLARLAVGLSLGLASVAGVSTADAANSSTTTQPSGHAQHSRDAAPRAATTPMTVIPFRVTLGGGRSLPFAQIVIRSTTGEKLETTRANARGFAFVQRATLPSTFVASVHGGKAWKKAGRPVLKATVSVPAHTSRVVFISPVSGVASLVAAKKGISYAKALRRTTTSLHIPSWMVPYQYSTVPPAFSAASLLKWSKRHGDLNDGLRVLAGRIAKGKSVPDFSMFTSASKRPRSTASWVGESVMDAILEGSTSFGTEAAIGDMFGQSNPDAQMLTQISDELQTITNQLTVLQNSMNQLIAIMEQTELNVLTASMSTIMGNTFDQWASYQSAMELDPTSPDYQGTIAGFAQLFNQDITPFMGEFTYLFAAPGITGVIPTLYANNDAPWWMASDVENIQSTIDYFGTYQAMATALMNESWWFPGTTYSETPEFIAIENNVTYAPQNANIYLSIPTSVNNNTIVVPSQQMAYQLFPGTTSYVQQKMNLVDGKGNCSNMGKSTTYGIWPMVLPSTTTWSATWGGMITNPSFSLSPSTAYTALAKPRSVTSTSGETTTYQALETLANGAPEAWVMVSAQSEPIASYYTFEDDSPVFWSWLWCGGTSVSLDNPNQQPWFTSFDTDADGDNIPGGQGGLIYGPVPVGVLAQQPGSYAYVPPTN